MTPEDQAYFESQIDTFASEGWKYFAEQVEKMRVATDRVEGIAVEDVRFKQGELSMMRWMLNWPKMVQSEYETQLAEEKEPADASV